MRILAKVLLATAVVAVCVTTSGAFGQRRSGCGDCGGKKLFGHTSHVGHHAMTGGGNYVSGTCDGCGVVGTASNVGSPCGMSVSYVEKVVTSYRQEMRTRPVKSTVYRTVTKEIDVPYKYYECVAVVTPTPQTVTTYKQVTKEIPYTYTVSVPVVTPTPQTVTTYKQVTKQVPYTYTVSVPYTVPVQQQVVTYKQVTKQVPYEYTVNVPVVTPTTRTETYYTMVQEKVTENVTSCRMAQKQIVDPCTGCCRIVCVPETVTVPVVRTVCKSVPMTRQVTVNLTSYKQEVQKGMRTVCEVVPVPSTVTVNTIQCRTETKTEMRTVCEVLPVPSTVTVNVTSYKTETKTAMRTVCEVVAVPSTVTVNVTSYKTVEKSGTAKQIVCEQVREVVTTQENYCVSVPYTTTVRVPVYAPSAPCGPTTSMPSSVPCGGCDSGPVATPTAPSMPPVP